MFQYAEIKRVAIKWKNTTNNYEYMRVYNGINMSSAIIFRINDEVTENFKDIKCLEFIINQEIKIKDHIEYICKKIVRINNKVSIMKAINAYFEYKSTLIYICCKEWQVET